MENQPPPPAAAAAAAPTAAESTDTEVLYCGEVTPNPNAGNNPDYMKMHNTNAGERCQCGCVPNVLSMFQMAELRAKRRAQKAKEDAAAAAAASSS
jgi:hypothetical protein